MCDTLQHLGVHKVNKKNLSCPETFSRKILATLFIIPEQTVFPQMLVSVEGPMHAAPPYFGVGLLHSLVLFLVPPPHVVLQGPYWDQLEYDPLTGKVKVKHLRTNAL